MNSRGRFFIVFIITCMVISFLFYLVFRHKNKPLIPSYFSKSLKGFTKKHAETSRHDSHKKSKGLPGMQKKHHKSSDCNNDKRGKPLPEPNMPKPAVPLIAKVSPPGPPARKKMME